MQEVFITSQSTLNLCPFLLLSVLCCTIFRTASKLYIYSNTCTKTANKVRFMCVLLIIQSVETFNCYLKVLFIPNIHTLQKFG